MFILLFNPEKLKIKISSMPQTIVMKTITRYYLCTLFMFLAYVFPVWNFFIF